MLHIYEKIRGKGADSSNHAYINGLSFNRSTLSGILKDFPAVSIKSFCSANNYKCFEAALVVVISLLIAFSILRIVYAKIHSKWTNLLEILDLQEKNTNENFSGPNRSIDTLSSKESQMECQNIPCDEFDDAFTRVLSSFQNANSSQVFLRRDDISVLLTKLVEVGACASSQRLTRRMTFMDINMEDIRNRSKSFNDFSLRSRSNNIESCDSQPDESVESLDTGELEEELKMPVSPVMPRERESYHKMLEVKGKSSLIREKRSKSIGQLRFADAMVSYETPIFLLNESRN